MSLFTKRHYEWFSCFACENLTSYQTDQLISALEFENPSFNEAKFRKALAIRRAESEQEPSGVGQTTLERAIFAKQR